MLLARRAQQDEEGSMSIQGMHFAVESSARPKTMTDKAYLQLRTDIVSGRLKQGTKLRVEELRSAYEMGATPLREALSRLSADGFVISEGQRGFKVVPMSAADLQDITNVRTLVETEALRNSIINGNDAWESRLVAAYYHLSKLEAQEGSCLKARELANEEFHAALLAGCNSPLLLRMHSTLYDQHRRYRNISLLTNNVTRNVHEEHALIYEAAIARRTADACSAAREHIKRTMEIISGIFSKSEAPSKRPGE